MPRWVVGEMLTGKITAELEVKDGTWADQLNSAATFGGTVLLDNYVDPATGRKLLDVRDQTNLWRSFYAAIDRDTGRVHAAGPIIGRPYNADEKSVKIAAAGLWAYWFKRVLAPPLSAGQRITSVTTKFLPADGLSKGTVAKRLVQQSMLHVGGNLPIDMPADSPGSTEREYPGFDAALIGDRMKQLVEVQNGPDIVFQPYLADDTHIRWRMKVGTEEDPFVHSAGVPVFNYTAPQSGASALTTAENGSAMASRNFQLGGGQTDEVLAGQAYDSYLLDRGWPLLESVVSRSSVSQLSTLDDYALDAVRRGRAPLEAVTIKFRAMERPYLSGYTVGDFTQLLVAGDPWVPDDTYYPRIVGLAGTENDEDVAVTFMEGVAS